MEFTENSTSPVNESPSRKEPAAERNVQSEISPASLRLNTPRTQRLNTPRSQRINTPRIQRKTTPRSQRLKTPRCQRLNTPRSQRQNTPSSQSNSTPKRQFCFFIIIYFGMSILCNRSFCFIFSNIFLIT